VTTNEAGISRSAVQTAGVTRVDIKGTPLPGTLRDASVSYRYAGQTHAKHLTEQEKALAAYEREYSLPAGVVVPPGFKFKWLKQLCDLLVPLEEATRHVCTDAATAADVIPIAMAVKTSVQRSAGDDMRSLRASQPPPIPKRRACCQTLPGRSADVRLLLVAAVAASGAFDLSVTLRHGRS